MEVQIVKLGHSEKAPLELLLKADPSEEMINKYLYAGECYLAKSAEETIGVMVLLPTTEEEIEIKNISIADKYQGQGVGSELIKFAIRISKLEGFRFLVVKTADSSVDTQRLYEKHKFEHYFTVKSHFIKYYPQPIYENGKQAVDQIVMRRVL